MPEFTRHSSLRQVLDSGPDAEQALWRHGYEVGPFPDTLSQYQSLEEAGRTGQLRDLEGLLQELNRA